MEPLFFFAWKTYLFMKEKGGIIMTIMGLLVIGMIIVVMDHETMKDRRDRELV